MKYKRYKGILFSNKDIYKITKIDSLENHIIKFAYRFIRHLYASSKLSAQEIADLYEVNIHLINIILSRDNDSRNPVS